MRKLLTLSNGKKTEFTEPFYLYDNITIFDKESNTFALRQRSTAVSLSTLGEIVLATTICSKYDQFNKKVAREILNKRVLGIIEKSIAGQSPINSMTEGAFYFQDKDIFVDFCNAFDDLSVLTLTPYEFRAGARKEKTTKKHSTPYSGVTKFLMVRSFIEKHYKAFMNAVIEAAEQEEEAPFDTSPEEATTSGQ